jgi:hypothetical protein
MDFVEQSEKSQLKKKDSNIDQFFPDQRLQDLLITGKNNTDAIDSKEDNYNPFMINGREVPDSMKPNVDKKGDFNYDKWQNDLQDRQLTDAKQHGIPSDNVVEEYKDPNEAKTNESKDALEQVVNDQNREKEFNKSYLDEIKNNLENDKSWIVGNAGEYIENNNVNVFVDNTESFQDPNNIAEAREWIDEKGNLHKDIAFNDSWIDKLSPDQIKADITHEVGHLKGGDEVQAWLDEAQTGYSETAKDICFRSDRQQKTYNEIKHDLISRCHYEEKDFDY